MTDVENLEEVQGGDTKFGGSGSTPSTPKVSLYPAKFYPTDGVGIVFITVGGGQKINKIVGNSLFNCLTRDFYN